MTMIRTTVTLLAATAFGATAAMAQMSSSQQQTMPEQTTPGQTTPEQAMPQQSTPPATSSQGTDSTSADATATTPLTNADVTDSDVNQFATAVLAVQKLENDATVGADDKQTQMAAAVKQAGLTPGKFNAIAKASQSDPALMQRIQTAASAQMQASAGSTPNSSDDTSDGK